MKSCPSIKKNEIFLKKKLTAACGSDSFHYVTDLPQEQNPGHEYQRERGDDKYQTP